MLDSGKYGSEPKFLFKLFYDDWIFNDDNWNGGDILRQGLLNILDEEKRVNSHEIKYYHYDGQTTILILTSENWYEVSWYKNRGRTDIIRMNGEPIYLYDYIDLCNSLNITLS